MCTHSTENCHSQQASYWVVFQTLKTTDKNLETSVATTHNAVKAAGVEGAAAVAHTDITFRDIDDASRNEAKL